MSEETEERKTIDKPDFMTPCSACPWRRSNQGQPHPGDFYSDENLSRLWDEIRGGGGQQTCHPTDPSVPEHEAKEGAKTRECPGSLILVFREMKTLEQLSVKGGFLKDYLMDHPKGLTARGAEYYATRYFMGSDKIPILPPPMPAMDVALVEDVETYGLPWEKFDAGL